MKPGWHICTGCNHVYEEALEKDASETAPMVSFHDLPDDWKCPGCGAAKVMYHDCKCVSMTEEAAAN